MGMLAKKKQRREAEIPTSSMADIAFLLLLYFLVTSTLQPEEADLGMSLPAQVQSKVPFTLDPLKIRIDSQGLIFKDTEEISTDPNERDLPKLVEQLTRYKEETENLESKPIVIIEADNETKHQRLVDVMNTLTKVGIANVTLTGFREE